MAASSAYHPTLAGIPMPERVRQLPVDPVRRVPVPWFVEWVDGVPDFRVTSAAKFLRAVRDNRCWVCGDVLGRYVAFVIGPMCAVNRTSGEPPAHRDCGIFSARACPFLRVPALERNERDPLPESAGEGVPIGGIAIRRNPGIALVWVQRAPYAVQRVPNGAVCKLGDPTETLWFREGRPATRAEVEHSLETGLPALEALATAPDERALLERMVAEARGFLPAAPP